ncbi:13924_t:CDS:2, partial [Funneliformis geosporum]
MENLEDSFNVDNPPSMENLSIAEEVVDLNSMEGVTFTESTRPPEEENSDIFPVYPNRNKQLKTIALNILKYLPEDILREAPDFSAIKSSDSNIPEYGQCGMCGTPILMTTLLDHSLSIDDRDPLLPFQYDVATGENTHPIVQASKCAKCSQEISTQPSEPLVTFPCCKHIVHFECIEINRKLCPKCPTNYDLEKEGFYISPEIPRKRRRQEGEQKSTRGSRHKPLF